MNMSKSSTYSFSIPIELAILLEEKIANDHMTRSEIIRKALEQYLKHNSIKSDRQLLEELYKLALEIRDKNGVKP